MKRIYIPSHDPIPCELWVDIDDSWISTSRSEKNLGPRIDREKLEFF
jgi:hypothetical protein